MKISRKLEKNFLATFIAIVSIAIFIFIILSNNSDDTEIDLTGIDMNIKNIQGGEIINTDSYPTRIKIEKLNVDSLIQDVGITRSGKMGTPDGDNKYFDVGWYRYGPRPGEIGNAVIAGHFDDGYKQPAVFYEINKLNIGDEISVSYPDGQVLKFAVTGKEVYSIKDAPLEKIFGQTDSRNLNIITCNGEWSPLTKEYDHRTIIFTELIE